MKTNNISQKDNAGTHRRRRRQSLWIGCIGGLLVVALSSIINQRLDNLIFLNIAHTAGTIGLGWWFYEWFWKMPPQENKTN